MTVKQINYDERKVYFWSQVATIAILLAILKLELLPALLSGLLIYQMVESGSRRLVRFGINPGAGKLGLFLILALAVLSSLGAGIALFAAWVTSGPESVVVLLERMADVIDTAQTHLPDWMQQYLPANMDEWNAMVSDWLRGNARHISLIGRDIGVLLFHIMMGMLIGGMVALRPGFENGARAPLSNAIRDRVAILAHAFRRIVFSQIRISGLNTVLTAIFLLVVMPLMGSPLPLTKTMIAVTFFAGLLPIIGNLISNTVIVLISLSVSPMAAVGSLAFLIVIHKLEYFFNARIIGTQIRAKAWEILLAMVAMEAAFGLPGLVAAPIYYAYLKDELSAQKLIL